jgi:hypothetical protein
MLFDLKNAGETYQRMMQNYLGNQIGRNMQEYIDDVVITIREEAMPISDLRETFDNLDRYKLKVNPTKCSFGVPAGQILGFLVSARGINAVTPTNFITNSKCPLCNPSQSQNHCRDLHNVVGNQFQL